MPRLAIFTARDYTWSIEAWTKTIPELKKHYEVAGLYVFPDQLGRKKSMDIPFWYLRTFGIGNFLILGMYSLKVRIRQIFSGIWSFKGLAQAYGVEYHSGRTPNAPEVAQWLRVRNVDVVFITVGQVLKEEIINAPKIGIINKHAAVLPSCKGLFPFFWAHINGAPTGVTFHQVEEKIDTGRILVQKEYPRDQSMLRFYAQVFDDFPALAALAVDRLIRGEYQKPRADISPSYYGLPTREDVKGSSVKIAQWSDLFYAVRGN